MRIALLLSALLVGAASAQVTPTDLRVEHLSAPVGLDAEHPRLSWALGADHRRGARQTAYRIQVGTRAGEADLWDSGRVASDEQHLVPYAGVALAPGQTVYWRVEAWDETGTPSGRVASQWTTGRMGDWGAAAWVGVDSALAETIGMGLTGTPRLRRAFRIDKPVVRAMLHVTGLGQMVPHLNGARVGDDRMAPGWTDPLQTVLYESYDVTDRVREGDNVVGVELGGGLYRIPQGGAHADGRYAKYWDTIGPFQAIAHLTVSHPDGSQTVIVTDEQWRVGASPTVFSSIWGGEDFDARRDAPEWAAPGFDDRAWAPVRTLPGPGGALVAQTNPPIRAHEIIPAVAVTEPRPETFVVDLGQNHSGMPRLTVRGRPGQTVTLRPSEVLDADGTVDPTSLKHWGEIVFRYTVGSDTAETWQPRFTYTGYRYLQVEGGAMTAEAAAARDVPHVVAVESDWIHADAAPSGTLAISDPLVDGVHRMIVGAIRSNMMHVMTDCPHREKLGWLEEAYLMGPSVMYNYAVGPLYAKWANDMAEAQEPSGFVTTTAPEYTFFGGNFRDSPEWGSAVVQVPWLIRAWTADEAPLRRHYAAMARYADYLETRKDADGVIRYGLGDWYDIGPNFPGESQLTSKGVTATATQAANLDVLVDAARLLGHDTDARRWRALGFDTFGAFNRAFWKPEAGPRGRGHYDTGSQTAQAMPLFVGLVPDTRREAALATLVDDVEKRGDHPTAGDVGHRYLVQTLAAAGRHDILWRLATQTEAPSYGAQLLAGATTLTEAWDANPVQSQNHFMLGHLEEWFWNGLAGLSPTSPGWKTVRVAPQPVGPDSVRATYRSPYGLHESAWTLDGDRFTLSVAVPVGTSADVVVPTSDPPSVRESGRPAAAVLTRLGDETGRPVFRLGPGRYTFTSTFVP